MPAQDGPGFARRHARVIVPVAVVIVLLVGACVFDVAYNWGTIHAGVTVEGVEVGGMSVEEAADAIETQLQQRIDASTVCLYEGTSADGETGTDATYSGESGEDDALVESADAAEADSASSEDDAAGDATSDDATIGSDTDGDGTVESWELTSETLDIGIDAAACAQEAYEYGRQGNVVATRITAWFSGYDLDVSVTCNDESLASLVDEVNEAIGTEVVNSTASISEGTATLSEGSDGWLLDEDELLVRLSSAFLEEATTWLTTPMHTVAMYIQPDTAQRIVDAVNATIAEDVTVTYGEDTWTMDASALGSVIGVKALEPGTYLVIGDGTQSVVEGDASLAAYDMTTGLDEQSGYVLQAYVNQETLDDYFLELLGDAADGGAVDASFDTSSGEVVIVPSETGTGPDRASAELEMQELLFGAEEDATRIIAMTDTTIEPSFSTEDAEALGIVDKLGSWSIAMSGTSNRQDNIKLLCSLIDGSLIAPGATWSFNETTGERTEEKGFKTASTIVDGEHVDALGGGICQVATCVFNAVCYSGLGIVTRANHSYYIAAYDEKGFNDATVSWETPDFAWENDTDNYILLTATAETGGYVTVTLWGVDDGRTVTCERGEWEEGEEYETVYEDDDTLAEGVEVVEQSGVNGRSIYIHYLVESADGEVLHDINFHSVYQAEDEIIRVGTKSSSSSSDDDDEDDADEESSEEETAEDDSSSEDAADESSSG